MLANSAKDALASLLAARCSVWVADTCCAALRGSEVFELFCHGSFSLLLCPQGQHTVPYRQMPGWLLWLEDSLQLLINVNCGSLRNAGLCCSFSVVSQSWPASWLLRRHSFSSSKDHLQLQLVTSAARRGRDRKILFKYPNALRYFTSAGVQLASSC